jgi:methyl-accepting chemotaxis protein
MLAGLSLKFKLIALCLFLSLLTLTVGVVSYQSLSDVKSDYAVIPQKVMPKLEHLNEMFLSYRRIRITLRTLGLQGLTPENAQEAVKETEHAIAAYEKANDAYVALQFMPGQKEVYDKVQESWLDFKKTGEEVLALYHSGTPESKEKMLNIFFTDCPRKAKIYTEAINALEAFHKSVADKQSKNAEMIAERATMNTIILVVASTLIGMICGFFFSSVLSKQLMGIAEDVASAAEQTSAASTQLTSASTQLSSGSSESASSLEETVASLEELTSMVRKNSEHSGAASTLAQKSREEAQSGEQEISKLISAMSDISQSSKKIEDIINVIDDIAFQTNLLALNAAVEAARAGEQGKGFAVVAEAVRALAQRSAVAAKDISSLIKENVSKSEQGAEIANGSGEVFKSILESVKKVAELNTEIAAGSQEQTNGIQQISQAMNQLDQATQGNAASAEEVASSSEEMSSQANVLVNLVSNLKIIVSGKDSDGSQHVHHVTEKRTHQATSESQLRRAA